MSAFFAHRLQLARSRAAAPARKILILAMVAGVAALFSLSTGSSRTSAAPDSATFSYLVGSGLICTLPVPNPCPDVAMAENGDTIEIAGGGTFSVHPKSVTGGGTFTHKNSSGNVSGTWTANQLMSFVSYGQDGTFPAGFTGGRALIRITLSVGGTPVHDAILQIDCELGTNPPGHEEEGVRLVVQGGLNFNQKVSGLTVFIQQ